MIGPTAPVHARRSRQHYGRIVQLTVERLVEHAFSIDSSRLSLPNRGTRRIIFARHVAMYLAVVDSGLSHAECGRLFDRDRRSVAYAVARIEQARDDDPDLDTALDVLARRMLCALTTHASHLLPSHHFNHHLQLDTQS
jgi:chromosomal replication initiation ATPase DnaA